MNTEQSDRIDTTVTLIEVVTIGYGAGGTGVAIARVQAMFPGTEVLGIWRHDERGPHGHRSWAVEHLPYDPEDDPADLDAIRDLEYERRLDK